MSSVQACFTVCQKVFEVIADETIAVIEACSFVLVCVGSKLSRRKVFYS